MRASAISSSGEIVVVVGTVDTAMIVGTIRERRMVSVRDTHGRL